MDIELADLPDFEGSELLAFITQTGQKAVKGLGYKWQYADLAMFGLVVLMDRANKAGVDLSEYILAQINEEYEDLDPAEEHRINEAS